MAYVYVLKSTKNSKYYIGSTDNLQRRLTEHNNGQGGFFTKINRPWKLVCYQKYTDIKEARKNEKILKSYKGGNAFKKIINGEVPEWLKGAPC